MLTKQKILGALGGNFIETLIGFLVIMFVTRNYSQAEAGIYFIVIAIVAITNNLKEGFLQNGFVKYLVESNQDIKVERAGFILSLAGDFFKIAVFQLVSVFYVELRPFVPFFIFYAFGFSIYRWVLFIYKSKLAMKPIVQGNLLLMIVILIGLAPIYHYGLGSEWIFLISGLGYFVALILFRPNRKLVARNLTGKLSLSLLKKMSSFGKYGFFKEVSGSIAHQAAIFISAYLLTLEATSILGLASRYMVLISIPGASLAGILYPLILEKSSNLYELKDTAREGIGKMYALLIPMAIALIITAPFIIYFLHGPEYLLAAGILAFKVLATVFLLPLGSGYSSIMNAINKPKEITTLMIISSISNISLSVLLIYYFGLWGAAFAPIAAEFIGFYVMKRRLKKMIDFDVFSIAHTVKNFWIFWIKTHLSWKKLRYQS